MSPSSTSSSTPVTLSRADPPDEKIAFADCLPMDMFTFTSPLLDSNVKLPSFVRTDITTSYSYAVDSSSSPEPAKKASSIDSSMTHS